MNSSQKRDTIQVTYIQPRTPTPTKESQSKATTRPITPITTQEEHFSEEYIQLKPPIKESASSQSTATTTPTTEEEHFNEEEYIKLIEEERAKYAEAKKTISKLVNKV